DVSARERLPVSTIPRVYSSAAQMQNPPPVTRSDRQKAVDRLIIPTVLPPAITQVLWVLANHDRVRHAIEVDQLAQAHAYDDAVRVEHRELARGEDRVKV